MNLFTASVETPEGNRIYANNDTTYTLGLLYLHSFLESEGHNVRTYNLESLNYMQDIQTLVTAFDKCMPDYIGFQVYSLNRVSTYRTIEYIHEYYPDIQIVLGGVHATIMYDQIIKKYPYAIVVKGEGEFTFAGIVRSTNLSYVHGIAYWDTKTQDVICTQPRELIMDLDRLPFPKHEVIFENHTFVKTTASIISSRGCYASCSFCVLNPVSKRIVRFRSIKNLVDEIEYLSVKYPQMTKIFFQDDAFAVKSNRVIEICREIIHRKLDYIEYVCSSRMKPFKPEIIPYLERANFKVICFGFETGSDMLLKRCHKNVKISDAINTVGYFKASTIEPVLFLIVGLPGETIQTIKRTVKVVRYMQRNIRWLYFQDASIITPYPGTEIYEDMKLDGKINDDFWLSDGTCPVYTVDHSLSELLQYKRYLLDQIIIYPLSIRRIYNQLPNTYNILRYVVIKLYAKRRRHRYMRLNSIHPLKIVSYRLKIGILIIRNRLNWHFKQLKQTICH